MSITRRHVVAGAAAGAASLATGLAKPAIASSDPIRLGFLPALTGESSSTGIGMNRGTLLAVNEINAAGGINGRKIELISRDTQSDPTKAVNAANELTRRDKANVVWGPLNSGEALAAGPLIARNGVLQVQSCWVDSLTDTKKWPLSYRNAPTNQEIGGAAGHYVMDVLKLNKVAIIGDTTGYGTASVNAYVPMFKAKGASVVYQGESDAGNPDVKPELLRMRNAGAQVIMPWSVNAGFLARIINTRAEMGWDVPIVGQTTLGSGQTKALLAKPENWKNVYSNNFRPCCFTSDGKLPPRAAEFVEKLRKSNIDMHDTLLWWIAIGYDAPRMIRDTINAAGGTDPQKMAEYLNSLKAWPGVYGDITFTATDHNGYPADEVVMVQSDSFHDGAFNLAPGYAA